MNNQLGISKNLDLIGYVWMNKGDYKTALEYYSKSLAIARQLGNKRSIASVYHDNAIVYEKLNDPVTALRYAKEGLALSLEVGENAPARRSLFRAGIYLPPLLVIQNGLQQPAEV
jgi:tetratricopeptide (TPR) repeat protein